MISITKDLSDDPVLLKQLLELMLLESENSKGRIVHLEEENALLAERATIKVDEVYERLPLHGIELEDEC